VRKNDLDDDDDEVRDRLRVPLLLMDGDAHRPHHAQTTDAIRRIRRESRDAYLRHLNDAWKTAGRVPKKDADSGVTDPDAANVVERQRRDVTAEDVEAMRRKNHSEFSQRLEQAWRSGK
jgi:hypothetical protein